MKEKLIALLKQLGIWNDAKANEFNQALDQLHIEPATPTQPTNIDTSKITDPVMKQMFESLQSTIGALTQQNKTLLDTIAAEKQAREAAVKAQQEELKKQIAEKATKLVADALKEGKIPKAKEEWLKKFAERDLEAAMEWVKEAPVDKHLAAEQNKDNKNDNPQKKKKAESDEDESAVKSPLAGVNTTILNKVKEFAGISDNGTE